MRTNRCVGCKTFPCADVNKAAYIMPEIEVKPRQVRLVLISEAAPENPDDFYYAQGNPAFQQTTVQAFNDAGAEVADMQDILGLGVYLTTAIKCGKTGYGIKTETIKECSFILEKEIAQFPNVRAYLLMGDVAIRALNYISLRTQTRRAIPSGATYKLRKREFCFGEARAFPSYLQVGPSFDIEKSKRRMIAEDIAAALAVVKKPRRRKISS